MDALLAQIAKRPMLHCVHACMALVAPFALACWQAVRRSCHGIQCLECMESMCSQRRFSIARSGFTPARPAATALNPNLFSLLIPTVGARARGTFPPQLTKTGKICACRKPIVPARAGGIASPPSPVCRNTISIGLLKHALFVCIILNPGVPIRRVGPCGGTSYLATSVLQERGKEHPLHPPVGPAHAWGGRPHSFVFGFYFSFEIFCFCLYIKNNSDLL